MKYNKNYFALHTDHYLKRDLSVIPSFVWIKKQLAVKRGDMLLDAGCGTGYLLNFVCGEKVKGIGVDISPAAIKKAQQFFSKHHFLIGDINFLPFPSQTFDKIICFNVLEHLSQPKKAKKELWRVLKKGGILVAGTNIKNSLSWRIFKLLFGGDSTHQHEFSAKEFVDFFTPDFEILKVARRGCIARFPKLINFLLNFFLRGDILVKMKK